MGNNMNPPPITDVKIGFPIQRKSVNEGATTDVEFVADNAPQGETYYCTIKLLTTGSATFNVDFTHSFSGSTYNFVLNGANNYFASFELQALQDNVVDPLEDLDYHGYCYSDPARTIQVETERCNFKAVIANQDLTEDPHFFQNVMGVDEENKTVSENICYDLVGTAGDVYEILTDKILGKFFFIRLIVEI